MKLGDIQRNALQLLHRSQDLGDGWRQCSDAIFVQIIAVMPDELVEKDNAQKRARVTKAGAVVIRWL